MPSSCARVDLTRPFQGELDSIPYHGHTLVLVPVCEDRWADSFLPDTRERQRALLRTATEPKAAKAARPNLWCPGLVGLGSRQLSST